MPQNIDEMVATLSRSQTKESIANIVVALPGPLSLSVSVVAVVCYHYHNPATRLPRDYKYLPS